MTTKYQQSIWDWWNSYDLEGKFYITIEYKSYLENDATTHPTSLSFEQIEMLYHLVMERVQK